MAFIEANERTINALKKADKINLEDSSNVTADGTGTAFNFYETSNPPEKKQAVSGTFQLEGEFVPIMSGDNFYCTIWLPSLGQDSIYDFAGWAIDGTIHCRTASFRPTEEAYVIEACFAYQAGEGWVGSGTYGSDQDFRHSWMNATSEVHKSGGGVYYEPICELLSGFDGYHIIPLRWGSSINLKGVWT